MPDNPWDIAFVVLMVAGLCWWGRWAEGPMTRPVDGDGAP